MIRIILHGCLGRMGQTVAGIVKETNDMEIVAGIDRSGTDCPFPVFASVKECTVDADVIIDFSTASAIPALLDDAVSKKLPLVLCTTGLSEETLAKVEQATKEIPVLLSANMSLGINLMISLIQKAALVLTESGFDIEIFEKHHNQKKDAPSGTALYLANSINQVLPSPYKLVFDRSGITEPRSKQEIGVSAMRGGNIAGEHQVIFAGEDEILEIHHKAGSRRIFAIGAVGAARFLKSQPAGLYSMSDVIG